MASRERWMEVSRSSSAPMTSFNVEAFLGRLECLFLRRWGPPKTARWEDFPAAQGLLK